MHRPFVKVIPYINKYPKMEVGVLTGDVVRIPNATYWDSAQIDIAKFNFPIHISPGNHDKGVVFSSRYDETHSFIHKGNLFIILSPIRWNIEGQQKDFLIQTINENSQGVNHIFIFCHELIWWDPDNIFGNVKINYKPHYPGSTNYLTEIKPILDTLKNEVIFYAGDLGASKNVDSYMYFKEGNITLIASGMGGEIEDNFIITEIYSDGSLNHRLIGINDSIPTELMKFEDYVLPKK